MEGTYHNRFLRDFKPFQADPQAEDLDDSDFIRYWRRERLHGVHQGALHANIMTLCMWHLYKCLHDEVRCDA